MLQREVEIFLMLSREFSLVSIIGE
jgi:hypothetical protein